MSASLTRARRWGLRLAAVFAVLVVLLLIAGGAGPFLLEICAAWAALFMVAWLISRWIGGRPHYLENWTFAPDETVLWRDDRADVFILTTVACAAIARPMRLHRARVLVTQQYILIAMREFLTRRQRIVYLLRIGGAGTAAEASPFGGLFKTGYQTLVIRPEMEVRRGEAMQPCPYIALTPDRAALSSFNCAEFRIYTDHPDDFRLPYPA